MRSLLVYLWRQEAGHSSRKQVPPENSRTLGQLRSFRKTGEKIRDFSGHFTCQGASLQHHITIQLILENRLFADELDSTEHTFY